jgi:hypothetical protein
VELGKAADETRQSFLTELPALVGSAVGGDELRAALAVEVPGVAVRLDADSVAVGDRQLRSTLPRVTMDLDPPVDAGWLSKAWRIVAPVAVSGDAHQHRWHLCVSGAELPDPHGRRIVSHTPTAGRWDVDPVLAGRPPGPLPGVSSGASPAYDLLATGGSVATIEISRTWLAATVVRSDHPSLAALPAAAPADRGRRWRGGRPGATDVVVVSSGGEPLVAAGFRTAGEVHWAFAFTAAAGAVERHAGSTLLDALEALALDAGAHVVRLDASIGPVRDVVPAERHGYRPLGDRRGPDGADAVMERRLDRAP